MIIVNNNFQILENCLKERMNFSYFKKLVCKVLDILITWGKLLYYVYLCTYIFNLKNKIFIYSQFEKQDLKQLCTSEFLLYISITTNTFTVCIIS